MDAYYRGLWNLLTFTMQMTLILVLSLILGATPAFRRIIAMVSRLPRTQVQVVVLAVLTGGVVAYLNWGLSIALSPVIATLFAREAEKKGIVVDFQHFYVRQLSLDINSVNTIVLLLGVVLHGTVARFTGALRDAVGRAWPIVCCITSTRASPASFSSLPWATFSSTCSRPS